MENFLVIIFKTHTLSCPDCFYPMVTACGSPCWCCLHCCCKYAPLHIPQQLLADFKCPIGLAPHLQILARESGCRDMDSRVLREASWSWENEWAKLMCHHYDSKSNCAEDGSVADTARIGTAAVAHSSCSLLAGAMKQSNSRWVNADGRMPSSTLAAQIRASITATQEKAMVLQTREILHKRCRENTTAATMRINFIATTTSMGVGVPASTI